MRLIFRDKGDTWSLSILEGFVNIWGSQGLKSEIHFISRLFILSLPDDNENLSFIQLFNRFKKRIPLGSLPTLWTKLVIPQFLLYFYKPEFA